ncbi:MAG: hypothetical protein JWN01_573 [Patescibacteria group bacterium]|nr:hypothetical protein [Patescibacteria group bacterium]
MSRMFDNSGVIIVKKLGNPERLLIASHLQQHRIVPQYFPNILFG